MIKSCYNYIAKFPIQGQIQGIALEAEAPLHEQGIYFLEAEIQGCILCAMKRWK